MRRLRTRASRGAALACLAIGVVHAVGLASSPSRVYSLLEGAVAVVAVLTGLKMWFHNCFESHLAAGLLVTATVVSTLLAVTVGLPGGGAVDLTVTSVALLLLSVGLVGFLIQDGRVRRAYARGARRSYAQ